MDVLILNKDIPITKDELLAIINDKTDVEVTSMSNTSYHKLNDILDDNKLNIELFNDEDFGVFNFTFLLNITEEQYKIISLNVNLEKYNNFI